MDGTEAFGGVGTVVGNPVGRGLLLASADIIAVDRVSMEIMGFGLDEIEYIRLAGEQGLGCTELSRIKIAGEDLASVKRRLARVSLSLHNQYHFLHGPPGDFHRFRRRITDG